jgi:predicted enzyme related to lactoylglutathione lyase
MANNIPLIVFPVKDLSKAKKFYSTYLGTEPYIDGEYYVGYKLDDREVGLDPNGKAVVCYIDVENVEASVKTLQEVGAEIAMEPNEVGGGRIVAQVAIEGNVMGLKSDGN